VTDKNDTRQDPAADDPVPQPVAAEGLSPGVWVTGLIVLVLLLLAAFALV